MSDLTVAHEILRQLGGRKFIAMTGARNFVGSDDGMSFRIPGNITRNRINVVRITLTTMDTYTVVFSVLRGMTIKEISSHEDIYNENLLDLFRSSTGLETRMPRVIGL